MSTLCAGSRTKLHAWRGDCVAAADDARLWSAANPNVYPPYIWLASALVGGGPPTAAAREALAREIPIAPEWLRPRMQARDDIAFAALAGDFPSAEKSALEWQRAVASDPDARSHARPADELVKLYLETGDVARAGRVARDYLERVGAWNAERMVDADTVAVDATPRMLAAEHAAGLLTRDAWNERRAAWVDALARSAPRLSPRVAWLEAYAGVTETRDDAIEALALLGDAAPPAGWRQNLTSGGRVGWVYFLAGRADLALPPLSRAAHACLAALDPYEHTRASFYLGEALRDAGDVSGACTAYGVVLDRWGRAKPRSVTAERARARARELGCSGLRLE